MKNSALTVLTPCFLQGLTIKETCLRGLVAERTKLISVAACLPRMSMTRPPTEINFFVKNEAEINFGGGVSTTDVYDEATHRNYFFHDEAEINFGGGVSTTDVYDEATHRN